MKRTWKQSLAGQVFSQATTLRKGTTKEGEHYSLAVSWTPLPGGTPRPPMERVQKEKRRSAKTETHDMPTLAS